MPSTASNLFRYTVGPVLSVAGRGALPAGGETPLSARGVRVNLDAGARNLGLDGAEHADGYVVRLL